MKKRICCILLYMVSFIAFPFPVYAEWDATAKVITIEPSYMPDQILFKLDAAAGTCPAGNWMYYTGITYNPSDATKNVQAAYIGLLYALGSGKRVEVHGNVNCTATNIHPTNQ